MRAAFFFGHYELWAIPLLEGGSSMGPAALSLPGLAISSPGGYLASGSEALARPISDVITLGLALVPAPFSLVVVPGAYSAAAAAPRVAVASTQTVVGRAACPHSDYIMYKE
jgi:hypothetical protein